MSENKKDWFKIYRSLLKDEKLWLSEPFTKGQAWIDLIGRANFGTTEHISGPHCVKYYRGQLPTSLTSLAKRWKWSVKKTRNYLLALSEAGMVTISSTTKGTTLTIENYAFYQNQGQTKEKQKNSAGKTKEKQSADTKRIYKEETKNTQEKECVGSDEPFDPAETDESWREFLKQIGGGNNDD